MTNDVIYTVESRPPTGKLILFALQQFLSVIAATITVPILIGLGDHMAAALLGCGLGTLVYLFCTKGKSPVVISSSFAYIGALIMAVQGYGYMGIVLGGILCGSVYVILSIVIHFVGTAWIDKIMPPVVIGPVVACIGLGLAPSAVTNLLSASGFVDPTGTHPYNLLALLCGLIGFFVGQCMKAMKGQGNPKLINELLAQKLGG
jgi:uracil permease